MKAKFTAPHDLRAVGFFSRLEERIYIRHIAGRGVAGILCECVDFFRGYADVIEPLAADLFACAIAHSFLYIVALFICIEGVQPYENHVLILRFELRLAVYRP